MAGLLERPKGSESSSSARRAKRMGSSLCRNCAERSRFRWVGREPNSIMYRRVTPVCFMLPQRPTSSATARATGSDAIPDDSLPRPPTLSAGGISDRHGQATRTRDAETEWNQNGGALIKAGSRPGRAGGGEGNLRWTRLSAGPYLVSRLGPVVRRRGGFCGQHPNPLKRRMQREPERETRTHGSLISLSTRFWD
jgi:hypothetical protein